MGTQALSRPIAAPTITLPAIIVPYRDRDSEEREFEERMSMRERPFTMTRLIRVDLCISI